MKSTRELAPIVTLTRALVDVMPNNAEGLIAKHWVKACAVNKIREGIVCSEIISTDLLIRNIMLNINSDKTISGDKVFYVRSMLRSNISKMKSAADDPELINSYKCNAESMKDELLKNLETNADAESLAAKIVILDVYKKLIESSICCDEYDLADAVLGYIANNLEGKDVTIDSVTIKMNSSLMQCIRDNVIHALASTSVASKAK